MIGMAEKNIQGWSLLYKVQEPPAPEFRDNAELLLVVHLGIQVELGSYQADY